MVTIEGTRTKNVKYRTEEVKFEDCIYECRVVKDKNGEDLLIGSYALDSALHPGEWGDELNEFASKEAEEIYNEIFFFVDSWDLKHLNDNELIEELKESNPDWFD